MKARGAGDVWTWTAICADTKLIPCWFVGNRDAGCAYHFMHDLVDRLAHRVQLTTDGHRAYLSAVERVHQTLRVTPAMEAGVSEHVGGIDE
jgi:transposase-like protein